MLGIGVNGILRDPPAPVIVQRLARIRVHIEAWKIAARYIEADPVPALENQRSRIHLDCKLVGLARREQFRLAQAVAVARANDAIGDIEIDSRRKVPLGG